MADAKLDQPSSEVAAALSAAAGLFDETADLLDGFSDEAKENRQPLYRAESAVASGRALVGIADPKVTPQDLANEVRNNAQALRDNIQQASTNDGGDISGIVEPLLSSLMRLRQPNVALEEKAKEAALRYRQSLDPRVRALKGEIEGLEARFTELSESTSAEVTSVGEHLDTLKGEIDASTERVGGLISDQDSKFTEAQEERRKEFGQADQRCG